MEKNENKEPIKFTFTSFLYVMAGVILLVAILCAVTLFTTNNNNDVKPEEKTVLAQNEVIPNETINNLMAKNEVDAEKTENIVDEDYKEPETEVIDNETGVSKTTLNTGNKNTVDAEKKSNDYKGVTNAAFVPNN